MIRGTRLFVPCRPARRSRLRILAAGLSCALLAIANGAPARAAESDGRASACDRVCLSRTLDEYLGALAARDPRRLHWTVHARYTENGSALRIGDGLWATAESVGRFRMVFVDPVLSSLAFYGTVIENGSPVILALRLRLEGRRIAEVEHLVVRNGPAAARFAARSDDPEMLGWSETTRRASRSELAAAATAYFDGIEAVSAAGIRFAATCNRIENGQQTTNVENLAAGPFLELDSPSWRAVLAQGCAASIDSGANAHISEARSRRIVVLDEERAVAVAGVIFTHPGTLPSVHVPDQPMIVFPKQLRQPFDTLILEAFKLDGDRKIARVEAVGTVLPLGASSGWSDAPL
ncbi:MAG: hypothetical protein JWM75_3042, partial [Sphingomonas bacterium]|nr:hypothetical protein [Sphingomonas bacterium]